MVQMLFQLSGTLLLVEWLLNLLPWIALTVALCGGGYLVVRMVQQRREATEAIRRRADQQHNWVMEGDDPGVYGEAGATLMRDIRCK